MGSPIKRRVKKKKHLPLKKLTFFLALDGFPKALTWFYKSFWRKIPVYFSKCGYFFTSLAAKYRELSS
jgi:hypothetical protein